MNLKIILSGLFGTLAMTLFVNLVAAIFKKPLHAVKILSRMLQRGDNTDSRQKKYIKYAIASVVHYSIGVGFAYVFSFLLQQQVIELKLSHAILFGSLAGLTGILGWRIVFAIHPNPPKLELSHYLLVIWLGHLIFAAGVFKTYLNFE
jgi:H+/Cl- antiporter ClcA